MEEKVIRSDAGLAGIEAFAPGDAPGGQRQVGVPVHDAGTLAAEFQHHGRQVPGLGLHGDAAQGRTARQEDQVIAVLEQFPVHDAVALDQGHIILREGICDHPLQGCGNMRHVGRGFQDGGAARRNGTDQRVQQQLHGIVPGAHDKGAAQRLADDVAAGRHAGQRCALSLSPGPHGRLADGLPDLAVHEADLRHVRFLIALVKIGPEGVAKGFFPFLESGLHGLEPGDAPFYVTRRAGSEECPLPFHQFPDPFRRCVFHQYPNISSSDTSFTGPRVRRKAMSMSPASPRMA